MSEKNSVIMEVKNINLRFGGVIAIQDVSFNIFEGEIRAIIGPNGAGKSSMLNVINGFYHQKMVKNSNLNILFVQLIYCYIKGL